MLRDRRKKPSTIRPQVECLEDRSVPATFYGLTDANTLIRFDSETPGTIQSAVAITGLAPNESLAGIDFRPRTGQLYGVGVVHDIVDAVRTYRINPLTGVATQVGAVGFPVPGGGDVYGVDFDPTRDEIRVVN